MRSISHYSFAKPSQHAFTLLELAVVMVIVGLIVGGITAGKDLIELARIRKLGAEVQQISAAISTFRNKYDCLPGDCGNATSFFGTNSSSCPNGGGSTGTCNGNGDGFVNFICCGSKNVEHLYVWQHLSLAGLIPWSFSGSAMLGGTAYRPIIVGTNSPRSIFHPDMSYKYYTTSVGRQTIEIGALPVFGGLYLDTLFGAGLNSVQAYAFDSKFDDGLPEAGKIEGISAANNDNYNNLNTVTSSFNKGTACVSNHAYMITASGGCTTGTATGCTMEYKVDVP